MFSLFLKIINNSNSKNKKFWQNLNHKLQWANRKLQIITNQSHIWSVLYWEFVPLNIAINILTLVVFLNNTVKPRFVTRSKYVWRSTKYMSIEYFRGQFYAKSWAGHVSYIGTGLVSSWTGLVNSRTGLASSWTGLVSLGTRILFFLRSRSWLNWFRSWLNRFRILHKIGL